MLAAVAELVAKVFLIAPVLLLGLAPASTTSEASRAQPAAAAKPPP